MKNEYDIVIVGGGMVGAAIACALGGSRYQVALIESHYPKPYEIGQPHDLRVSALSVASETLLRNIGAWEGVISRRTCPYRRMKVWEASESKATLFDSDQIGEAHLGHIVENRITQLALLETLKQHSNIDLICPARTESVDYSSGSSLVQLEGGRELIARLLIGADGGESRVRQAAGIGITKWDYDQQALVASVVTAYPQQDITWQQFKPSGPLAFLPLSGNHASLVWYNSADEIKRLMALSDEAFLNEVQREFPACVGQIDQLLTRGFFPLKRQHAQTYVAEGVALAGDSAHMIHPLAGQGVNIGFMDVAMLAEVLLDAQEQGDRFYSIETLKKYEKARRHQNLLMMQTMDAFYHLFSNSNLPLKLLRNVGLGLADRLPFAKPHVTRFAMGLEGPVPSLAKRV